MYKQYGQALCFAKSASLPPFLRGAEYPRHKNALKRAVFLVGSEFRLRVPFGKPHTARDAGSHLWLTFAEQMC